MWTFDEIIAERGLPQVIRCDNGPWLTSHHFLVWDVDHAAPGLLRKLKRRGLFRVRSIFTFAAVA